MTQAIAADEYVDADENREHRETDRGEDSHLRAIRHRRRDPVAVCDDGRSSRHPRHPVEQPVEVGPALEVVVFGALDSFEHREHAREAIALIALTEPFVDHEDRAAADME